MEIINNQTIIPFDEAFKTRCFYLKDGKTCHRHGIVKEENKGENMSSHFIDLAKDAIQRAETGVGGQYGIDQLKKAIQYLQYAVNDFTVSEANTEEQEYLS